ncbi:MAG: hypothetical protein Q9178_002572 [Gyalolechia marmorata]
MEASKKDLGHQLVELPAAPRSVILIHPVLAAFEKGDGSGSGQGKPTSGKRREQVRHAQRYVNLYHSHPLLYSPPFGAFHLLHNSTDRAEQSEHSTHRQRTQNYIKTLESEVVRLRGSEGDLMSENKKLSSQVDILRTALILADVPLPAGFETSTQLAQPPSLSPEMPASVSFKTDNLNHQRLHVDWTTQPYQQPAPTPAPQWPTVGLAPSASYSRQGGNPSAKPLPTLPKDFDSTYDNPLPGMASRTLDTAEVAIDFVLALEHICMPHIPHPADPPSDEPTNHALLMSTALAAQAPGPPQTNSRWSANGSMIKELLNLASAINLQGEITPVEAWHRLRQHPGFSRLDKWALEKIKGDLSASVRCCK